ncbi:MAG: HNH endonuclease [Candidatus Methanoperedens sp.]
MEHIHYWKISPEDWGSDHENWQKQWSICIKEKKIAMGWSKVGDLSELNLDQIKDRLQTHYPIYKHPNFKTSLTRNAQQLLNFRNIENGAIIVANKGQKEIVGIGKVENKYYFNPIPVDFRHTLPVKWLDMEIRKIKQQESWLSTVMPINEQKMRELGICDVIKKDKIIQKYEEDIEKDATFSEREVKTRNFQQAFRNKLLECYQRKCAICDVDDEQFLRGCHIVPVSKDEKIASNRTNGICLCVVHDVAFEKGLISISDQFEVLVAESFKPTSSVLAISISNLNGKKIRMPIKYIPDKSYLKRHREIHKF